jgi:hypothetical protein
MSDRTKEIEARISEIDGDIGELKYKQDATHLSYSSEARLQRKINNLLQEKISLQCEAIMVTNGEILEEMGGSNEHP